MIDWNPINTAPEGVLVDTCVDLQQRNHQPLRRSGRLWFVPEGTMYVYYTPTHWREIKK